MPGDPFLRTTAWRRFRAAVLRQRPMCQVPGCGHPATDVDHIKTRRERPDLALDPLNVQCLCGSHHSTKTALRDRPAYRQSDKPLVARGCDQFGQPLSPDHLWNRGR